MNESNWWLFLMGAVVAYIVIPWRMVAKGAAVVVCVWLAYSFFTYAGLPPIYQWLGGIFFAVMAVAAARSEYRESASQTTEKKQGNSSPKPLPQSCFHCNGTGWLACYCPMKSGKAGIMGPACFECNDTKRKRCYMCRGSGKR